MLGRKQSVRNNEDWKNALDHIEETVSKKELDSLVKKTVKDIAYILPAVFSRWILLRNITSQ